MGLFNKPLALPRSCSAAGERASEHLKLVLSIIDRQQGVEPCPSVRLLDETRWREGAVFRPFPVMRQAAP